ncbi:MAG: lactate utilization protein [Epsilonproteobacteria bacterium]|nr:lactate utilization protein [Campylobacterota bacterium]
MPEKTIWKKRAETVIRNLKLRGINGVYFENSEEANEFIADAIKKGVTVGLGGSTTIIETKLIDKLRTLPINLLDRYKEGITKEEVDKMRLDSLTSDIFISSANAVTLSGQIVSCDGVGNRAAGMLFGPRKVILEIGTNKIVNNLSEAIDRIHNVAAPQNVIRFNGNAPCGKTGICDDAHCRYPERFCNDWVIIEGQNDSDRITVVFVVGKFGF